MATEKLSPHWKARQPGGRMRLPCPVSQAREDGGGPGVYPWYANCVATGILKGPLHR